MSRGQQMLMASLNRQLKVQQINNLSKTRYRAPAKVHLTKPPEPQSCGINSTEARGEEHLSAVTEPHVLLPETAVTGSELQPLTGSLITEVLMQPEEPPCVSLITEALTSTKHRRLRKSHEKNENAKQKHPLLAGCSEKCKKKCWSKISEQRRKDIHQNYWAVDYNQRRMWMSRFIKRCRVKRHRIADDSSRTSTLLYALPNEEAVGDDTSVCQKFFLSTLGYSNNRVVVELMKATASTEGQTSNIMPKPDQRGTAVPPNKKNQEIIEAHIMSFNPQVSHYRREHAPNRKYLPNNLSVAYMHSDYCCKHSDNTVSYEVYRLAIKKLNISFSEPAADQCDDCAYYEHSASNPVIAQEWKDHLEIAKTARQNYREDSAQQWPEDTAVFAADLQKVLLLPYLHDLKVCMFTSRLVTFNETFARMGKDKTKNNTLVVWNESVAGRKKEDIASAFAYVVEKNRDVAKFIFWLDNCASQNKNWSLYTMFTKLVNSTRGTPSEIVVKYLVAGHTHMDADTIHGHIEKCMKRKRDIYDFDDLVDVMKNSNRRNEVHTLVPQHFRDWPAENACRGRNIPLLRSIVQVRFVRGSTEMLYKTDFKGEEQSVKFLKKAAEKSPAVIPPPRLMSRGVSSAKKAKLLEKLVTRMPENRRSFWQNLPQSENSEDLLSNVE